MAKVLIVGMGDIGTRLAASLLAAGHKVHGLRRRPAELPGVHMIQADVTDPATLALPQGVDYVYVILTPAESSDEGYRRVFVDGLGNVLAALQGAGRVPGAAVHFDPQGRGECTAVRGAPPAPHPRGSQSPRRIFFVSSSAVYAQDNGEWVDEDSPTEATQYNGIRLLEAERLLRASGFASTTVRFAGIYGPGRLRLINWVRSGKPVIAEPPQWTNRIHVEDCVGLLEFLLEQDAAGEELAEIYNGVDDEPVPMHVVLDWVADELKLPKVLHIERQMAGQNKRLGNKRVISVGYRFVFRGFRDGYASVTADAE